MSAPTAPKIERRHSGTGFSHHVRQPYAWIILGGALFLAAWFAWTFFLAGAIR